MITAIKTRTRRRKKEQEESAVLCVLFFWGGGHQRSNGGLDGNLHIRALCLSHSFVGFCPFRSFVSPNEMYYPTYLLIFTLVDRSIDRNTNTYF